MRVLPCLSLLCLVACSSSPDKLTDGSADQQPAEVSLLASFDLPRQQETESLSALFFDGTTLFALPDTTPQIVPLTPAPGYGSWTVGAPLSLTGGDTSSWDGEGLTRGADGSWAVVADETAPRLERYAADGSYVGTIATPARFAMQAAGNMGIESLSTSPSGAFLFFANEGALVPDGPIASPAYGTRIRILRRELATGHDEEHAYLTDPTGPGQGGTLGVSDVTAFSDHEVLVLERGFQLGYGNTVRIYRADLASSTDVSQVEALDGSTSTLRKQLVVDLLTLPSAGVTSPETQPSPLLDNFEGLALGPTLPDGRRVLFVVSDDNQRATQVPRLLALAVSL